MHRLKYFLHMILEGIIKDIVLPINFLPLKTIISPTGKYKHTEPGCKGVLGKLLHIWLPVFITPGR
jgi:hypothetical protein